MHAVTFEEIYKGRCAYHFRRGLLANIERVVRNNTRIALCRKEPSFQKQTSAFRTPGTRLWIGIRLFFQATAQTNARMQL
jgi:hypothetical protein